MQNSLDKRLAALEAAAPASGADTEPATEEDWLRFCCDLFRRFCFAPVCKRMQDRKKNTLDITKLILHFCTHFGYLFMRL